LGTHAAERWDAKPAMLVLSRWRRKRSGRGWRD
jgi:hypothetical protein